MIAKLADDWNLSKNLIVLQPNETVHWGGKPDYRRRRVLRTVVLTITIFLGTEYLTLQERQLEGLRLIYAILLAINLFIIYSNAGMHYFVTSLRIVKERTLLGFRRREEIPLQLITEIRAKVTRGNGVLVFIRAEGIPVVFSYLKENPEKVKEVTLNAKRLVENNRRESGATP